MVAVEDFQSEIPPGKTVGRASDWTIRPDPEHVIRGRHQFVERVDDGARRQFERDWNAARLPLVWGELVGVDEVANALKSAKGVATSRCTGRICRLNGLDGSSQAPFGRTMTKSCTLRHS